jgi:threonyl-tRNA synthetase
MRVAGLRVELDGRGESIGRKIREAELRKIPNMLIVGDREAESDSVSLRTRSGNSVDGGQPGERSGGDQGGVPVSELIEALLGETRSRREPERVG